MDNKQARYLHQVLDKAAESKILSPQDVEALREHLPELPKQMTLEEIIIDVRGAWSCTSGNDWGGNICNMDVPIEDWLEDLHAQLKGLMDAPATVPALPAGMRIAEHEEYGRVVTSPKPDQGGVYVLLVPRPKVETGADWEYAHKCELTFIDAEPAPAQPEFLETEADYENAPEGTVVSQPGQLVWVKDEANHWTYSVGTLGNQTMSKSGPHRVLRWGWGE